MRTAIFTLVIGGLPLAACADQDWSQSRASERQVTRITAPIDLAVYDGGIWITHEGKPMLVSLGNPSDMARKGVPPWMVANGVMVTVDVLNEPADLRGRQRAQRITIDGKTLDLL